MLNSRDRETFSSGGPEEIRHAVSRLVGNGESANASVMLASLYKRSPETATQSAREIVEAGLATASVCRFLLTDPHDDAGELLIALSEDPRADIRIAVAEPRSIDPDDWKRLARMMTDGNPVIAAKAARALGSSRVPEVVPVLERGLESSVGSVRRACATSLVGLGDLATVDAIRRASESEGLISRFLLRRRASQLQRRFDSTLT